MRTPVKIVIALFVVVAGLLWIHDLATDRRPLVDLAQDPLDPVTEPLDVDHPPPIRPPTTGFIPSRRGGRAVVVAVGDGADGGERSRRVAELMVRTLPDRVLYLGDVYPAGTEDDFREHYATTFGRLAKITAPTPGNHEWDARGEGYEPYWREVVGTNPPSFYAFSLGGWQLLSLNSEADHGADLLQGRWLRDQLRSGGTCRLAFWHRPRYSAGTRHGDQPDLEPFWEILVGHAAIVINGHEHNMQVVRRRGITQFVAGTGGHSHYPIRRPYRGLTFSDQTADGVLALELRPGVAVYRFIAVGGRVLASGRVRCAPP